MWGSRREVLWGGHFGLEAQNLYVTVRIKITPSAGTMLIQLQTSHEFTHSLLTLGRNITGFNFVKLEEKKRKE